MNLSAKQTYEPFCSIKLNMFTSVKIYMVMELRFKSSHLNVICLLLCCFWVLCGTICSGRQCLPSYFEFGHSQHFLTKSSPCFPDWFGESIVRTQCYHWCTRCTNASLLNGEHKWGGREHRGAGLQRQCCSSCYTLWLTSKMDSLNQSGKRWPRGAVNSKHILIMHFTHL